MALYNGHIDTLVPYISYTGSLAPEAGFFSLFIFFEALLCKFIFY